MLKDRRVLIEQALVQQKRICGRLYLDLVMERGSAGTESMYEGMKDILANLQAELSIVDQMIADGAE